MEKQIITFSANEQILKKTAGQERFADDVVGYIEAHFDLGDNWTGYDSIRAVWYTAFAQISTVLDQDGVCLVPPEVCNKKEVVNVNLVGSIVENNELTDRLTTYPIVAFIFDGNARVEGSETAPITPSQFEQYVAIVEALVGSVKDIDHATLNADYTLTIYYSDGTSDTVGPIRGEQGPTGPTGNGIASIAKTGTSGTNPVVDTYTITYTNGQTTTFTVTNGVKGDTGNGIQSIYKTGTAGAVDTYTILYTDGNTTEFTVTNGEVTNAVLAAAIQQAKEDLVDQFAVKDTASGVIASFPDGADWPAKNVLADINPVQDLNGYSNPWPAGGGKNKYGNGDLTINGFEVIDLVNPLPAGTWNLSAIIASTDTDANTCLISFRGQNAENYGSLQMARSAGNNRISAHLTTSGEATKLYVYAANSAAASTGDTATFKDIQIESGSAETSFEPYFNICPISGRTECVTEVCGINVWDEEWENGTFDVNTGENYSYATQIRTKNNIPVVAGATYYANVPSGIWTMFLGADGSPVNPPSGYYASAGKCKQIGGIYDKTFTIPNDCSFIKFYCQAVYGATYNHDISINYPSTEHDYHAYDGDTYTVSWQTEAGTVYGGTIDLTTGVLTVDTAEINLGTLDYTKYSISQGNLFRAQLPDVKRNTDADNVPNFVCSEYPTKSYNGRTDISVSQALNVSVVDIINNNYNDPAVFKSAVNGTQLVYELATPITYQLTPTEVELLLGANNVWADTGDIEVTYVADTKLYIDKMTA